MTSHELAEAARERQEKAEAIVSRLQRAGWDVDLSTVYRNFAVFDRWANGMMSLGYLAKMTGIHKNVLEPSAYDALAVLKRHLEAEECECPGVKLLLPAIEPIADSIRSIQCQGCSKFHFIRDLVRK